MYHIGTIFIPWYHIFVWAFLHMYYCLSDINTKHPLIYRMLLDMPQTLTIRVLHFIPWIGRDSLQWHSVARFPEQFWVFLVVSLYHLWAASLSLPLMSSPDFYTSPARKFNKIMCNHTHASCPNYKTSQFVLFSPLWFILKWLIRWFNKPGPNKHTQNCSCNGVILM